MAKKRTAEGNGKPAGKLTLPVGYGNVTIGTETARLGITISRSNLDAATADRNLCGRRLTGKIIAVPKGHRGDERPLPGFDDTREIEGVFDVKSIGLTTKVIRAGLTFSLDKLDVPTLAAFAQRDGRIVITEITAIPDDDGRDDGDDEEADEPE
jgi:hypothetical protein